MFAKKKYIEEVYVSLNNSLENRGFHCKGPELRGQKSCCFFFIY